MRVLFILFIGCVSEIHTAAPNGDKAFPITLSENHEKDITIEAAPARIISLAPSNTEILFALGLGQGPRFCQGLS